MENECCKKNVTTELAKELYEAYCTAVGGVAFNGEPLPTWEAFTMDEAKTLQVAGWYEVATIAQIRLTPADECCNEAVAEGFAPEAA